jgi:hypothetical protein
VVHACLGHCPGMRKICALLKYSGRPCVCLLLANLSSFANWLLVVGIVGGNYGG